MTESAHTTHLSSAPDVLFAPGPHDPTAIKALVDAVRPKPINVLVVRDSGLSVADIAALGVRRISVGGALALAAWTGFHAFDTAAANVAHREHARKRSFYAQAQKFGVWSVSISSGTKNAQCVESIVPDVSTSKCPARRLKDCGLEMTGTMSYL